MTTHKALLPITLLLLMAVTGERADAQLMTTCADDSPERHGQQGCTVIASRVISDGLKEPVFWHIDRFQTLQAAQAAAGVSRVAFEAGGTPWLIAIESQLVDHRGGEHVAQVGPLPLPTGTQYKLQVQTSAFTPGMYSLPHHHSGVEAVYVLEGEACFETPTRAHKLQKGESLAIPAGVPMRAVVTGSGMRRVLAIILHDASQPATMRMEDGTGPPLVVCK